MGEKICAKYVQNMPSRQEKNILAKQREVTSDGMEENVGPCLGQMMKDESGKINELKAMLEIFYLF